MKAITAQNFVIAQFAIKRRHEGDCTSRRRRFANRPNLVMWKRSSSACCQVWPVSSCAGARRPCVMKSCNCQSAWRLRPAAMSRWHMRSNRRAGLLPRTQHRSASAKCTREADVSASADVTDADPARTSTTRTHVATIASDSPRTQRHGPVQGTASLRSEGSVSECPGTSTVSNSTNLPCGLIST